MSQVLVIFGFLCFSSNFELPGRNNLILVNSRLIHLVFLLSIFTYSVTRYSIPRHDSHSQQHQKLCSSSLPLMSLGMSMGRGCPDDQRMRSEHPHSLITRPTSRLENLI